MDGAVLMPWSSEAIFACRLLLVVGLCFLSRNVLSFLSPSQESTVVFGYHARNVPLTTLIMWMMSTCCIAFCISNHDLVCCSVGSEAFLFRLS